MGIFSFNPLIILEVSLDDFEKQHIQIYSREGNNIPHFHIISTQDKSKADVCIRLDRSDYFKHGRHVGELKTKQAKKLNAYLRELYRDTGRTRWQRLVDEWNKVHPDNIISDENQPDYSQIN